MKLSLNNFLYGVKQIITGDSISDGGFLKDVSVSPSAVATTGSRATAENAVPADVIVLDANGEDVIVNVTVPRDYDEALDHLKVVLLVAHVSGTSVAVQADSVSKGSPSEVYADLATFTPATAQTVDAAFSIGEVTADVSSLDTERHDNLSVNFAASAVTGVGVVHVLGVRIEYRSTLVSYDESTSAGADLR